MRDTYDAARGGWGQAYYDKEKDRERRHEQKYSDISHAPSGVRRNHYDKGI